MRHSIIKIEILNQVKSKENKKETKEIKTEINDSYNFEKYLKADNNTKIDLKKETVEIDIEDEKINEYIIKIYHIKEAQFKNN